MAGHTPLPWEVVPSADDDEWGIRRAGEGTGMSVAQMLWSADAHYIVNAMNGHRQLVDLNLELVAVARLIVAFHNDVFCTGRPLTIDGRHIDHTRLNAAAHLAQRALKTLEPTHAPATAEG